MVSVFCIDINSIDSQKYEVIRALVSEERRYKADRYINLNDSIRSVCSELLMNYCFYDRFGKKNSFNVSYGMYGKPYIKDEPNFYYNSSHSGDWVVGAYSDKNIGIDVEKIQSNGLCVMQGVCSDDEMAWICGEDIEKDRRFIQVWTIKESYVKYLGMGLHKDMKSFSVDLSKGRIIERINDGVTEEIPFHSIYLDKEHYMTVCTESEITTVLRVDISDIINILMQEV